MTSRNIEIRLMLSYSALLLIAVIFIKMFSFTPVQGLSKVCFILAVILSLLFNCYIYLANKKSLLQSAKDLANKISAPFSVIVYWLLFPLFTTYLLWTVLSGVLPMFYTHAFGQPSEKIYHGKIKAISKKYCPTQFEFKSAELDHFLFRQCINPTALNLAKSQNISIHATVQSSRFGSIIKSIHSIDSQ